MLIRVVIAFVLSANAGFSWAFDNTHALLPYTDRDELIFVLSELSNPPTGMEPPNATTLTVHHLVVDQYFSILADFNTHFDRYEQLAPTDLPAAWPSIQAEFQQLGERYMNELNQSYRALVVSGEIASRFGVDTLPAVIQMRGRNLYKISYNASDFDQAIDDLNGRDYETLTR